jgi:hypothetical protein
MLRFLADSSGEPTNFHEAYNFDTRVRWSISICKDFEDMKNKGVWKVIPKEKIPVGRRCVKSLRAFKIKRNGIFRARLVA